MFSFCNANSLGGGYPLHLQVYLRNLAVLSTDPVALVMQHIVIFIYVTPYLYIVLEVLKFTDQTTTFPAMRSLILSFFLRHYT